MVFTYPLWPAAAIQAAVFDVVAVATIVAIIGRSMGEDRRAGPWILLAIGIGLMAIGRRPQRPDRRGRAQSHPATP